MVLHPDIDVTIRLPETSGQHDRDRNALRKMVLEKLLKEMPGAGKGDRTAKYRYNVETLRSGQRIFLTRPAVRSKGFDFVIHVENHQFAHGRDNPAHDHIRKDLEAKRESDPRAALRLLEAIEKVFRCEDPDDVLQGYGDLSFDVGLPVDLVVKVVKWFFIEQDIRFWNWSGRRMFMDGATQALRP